MSVAVVDTNVVLVANCQHAGVSQDCIAICAQKLQKIMKDGKLALDNCFRILIEYQKKTTPRTGNGAGDAFVKWALQNNRNPQRVDLIEVSDHTARGYESFPDDPALQAFDPPDRIFVAVACIHPSKPPILQAVDSKWLEWAEPLRGHGITVEFLCKDDIARFHARKLES